MDAKSTLNNLFKSRKGLSSRTGGWGGNVSLRGKNWRLTGENCTKGNFAVCIPRELLTNQWEWDGQERCHVWGGIEIFVTVLVGLPEGTLCNGNPFLATVISNFVPELLLTFYNNLKSKLK